MVTLLDLLREQLHLAGTKKGCDHGQCGACTVLVDGRRKSACLLLAVSLDGVEVTTVEGLGNDGALHPLQQACIDRDAFQCGYCTPEQICSAVVHVEGPAGSRTIAFADFHRLPDETPHLDSTLAQGELVTAVELPAGKGGQHHTVKLRDRLSYAFALIAREWERPTCRPVPVYSNATSGSLPDTKLRGIGNMAKLAGHRLGPSMAAPCAGHLNF